MQVSAGVPAPRVDGGVGTGTAPVFFIGQGFGLLGCRVKEMHKVIASVFGIHGNHVGDEARQDVVLETPGQSK